MAGSHTRPKPKTWANYGNSRKEALANAEILALRVIAEQLENSETAPYEIQISIPA